MFVSTLYISSEYNLGWKSCFNAAKFVLHPIIEVFLRGEKNMNAEIFDYFCTSTKVHVTHRV